ncbi:AzlD domain-containing protein [Paenibacillus yanchengensis]|uniref:AzlD domain-containing protein n=1 Tax=Paenibacillus yanchengensis TaxID=2035833 RepID=A0ABW4YR29_9BACL
MEVRWSIFFIIIGAAFVTFLPRVLPLIFLSQKELPNWLVRWLNYVPIAVMAALIGQSLFLKNDELTLFKNNLELFAALPTFLAAIFTRSLAITVVVGIISIIILRFLF